MSNRPKTYKKKLTDGEKIIKLAKERHRRAVDAQSNENNKYKDNINFTYLPEYQWPEPIRKQRTQDGRPCETVNRMPVFVRSIVNEWKQNSSGVKVLPADDGADKKTAEILTGIIRNIETQSNAPQIKGNAFGNAVAGCKGFYRIVTEWEDGGFTQCIKILPVQNTLAVKYDCDDTSLDGSGWRWAFIEDELSEEEFESRYPDADASSWTDTGDGWVSGSTDKKIRIAEYFYKEKRPVTLCLLDDGKVVREDDLQDGMNVVETRESEEDVVKWIILGGDAKEPLEQKDWAGKYIPIVPIWGDSQWVNGKRVLISAMEYSHGAQRMLNYWRSTEIELLSLQNKAPYILTATQLGTFKPMWDTANAANRQYLVYQPDPEAPGRPQREAFPSPPSGILQGAANAAQDIMDTSGIQEAGLGMQSNETSGRAINARSAQGKMATLHFQDNAKHADLYCGRILVDLIPRIIDTPQVVRTLGLDGSEKMVPVNQEFEDKDKNGNPVHAIYDLSVGKYDVVISSAPAFQSMRQEAQELIAAATQGNPALWQTHGDLIFKGMDIPYSDEFAERSKKTLPTGLAPAEDAEGPQIPMEIQQQLEQMQMHMQQMAELLQQQEQALKDKQAEMAIKAAELELKAREVTVKEVQAQAQLNQSQQRVDVNATIPVNPENDLSEADKLEIDLAAKLRMKEMDQQHAKEMKLLDHRLQRMTVKDDDNMDDINEDGDICPSPLVVSMAQLQEGMQQTQEQMAAMSSAIANLTAVSAAPKKLTVERDSAGNLAGAIVVPVVQ